MCECGIDSAPAIAATMVDTVRRSGGEGDAEAAPAPAPVPVPAAVAAPVSALLGMRTDKLSGPT
eukprot:COSAG01_NODE_7300_length_3262_cov_2.087891_1_plen_64_part_00